MSKQTTAPTTLTARPSIRPRRSWRRPRRITTTGARLTGMAIDGGTEKAKRGLTTEQSRRSFGRRGCKWVGLGLDLLAGSAAAALEWAFPRPVAFGAGPRAAGGGGRSERL